MILKDVASIVDMDISTISRVANSKHAATPYGIFSLKYFFSESLSTDTGEEVSTREVKTILNEAIKEEDKSNPLTDEKLAELLKQKGYLIFHPMYLSQISFNKCQTLSIKLLSKV